MAATESPRGLFGSIVLAAAALPGVAPPAQAEEAPESAVVAFKWSVYRESQAAPGTPELHHLPAAGPAGGVASISGASGGGTGGELSGRQPRIRVSTPSFYESVPIGRHWAVEAVQTLDTISGASPSYYSDMAGAGQMEDRRKALELKVAHYDERQSWRLGLTRSTEHDYRSTGLSAEGRWSSDDQNTTWNAGAAMSRDRVDPLNQIVTDARKTTRELQLGVTQAVNPQDLAQLQVTFTRAAGYLDDPYKLADVRPDRRHARIVLLRWNHALDEGALRTGYRRYHDDFGIGAHTLDIAWELPHWGAWTWTPSLRYYTQSAASFYVDPPPGFFYPGPAVVQPYFTTDQRMAAFGALTLGGAVHWQMAAGWSADLGLDRYRQSTHWRAGGGGSPGLVPLDATTVQVGLSHSF